MSNIFEKVKTAMFGEAYYDEDEYDDGYEDEVIEHIEPTITKNSTKKQNVGKVVNLHNNNAQTQVFVMAPVDYEDAQGVCDHIKAKRAVVVNLENVEYPTAQRIMDFLSGACYSLEGTIQRVSNNIFIIAPENVDVSGYVKEELKTKGIVLPWVTAYK